MLLSYAIDASLILFFALVFKKKILHSYEYIFIYLVFTFFFITLVDFATPYNSHLFGLTKDKVEYWSILIVQLLIIPILVLFYLERLNLSKSKTKKLGIFVFFVLLIYLIEQALVHVGYIKYKNWQAWWSPIAWGIALGIVYLIQQLYHKHLIKDGYIS